MTSPSELNKTGNASTLVAHIRLLRMFYFILAGLSLLGLFFLVGHYFLMTHFMQMAGSGPVKGGKQWDPVEVMLIFRWFYVVVGVFVMAGGILNLLTARFLGLRRHRQFCLLVGGLNCVQFPLGTALGVFTLVVLTKPEAEAIFGARSD